MAQYLYAAAVQGIQDFIFDTDKLQEIAGASEIVEQICTDKFAKMLGKKNAKELADDPNLLVGAAGNIKYLFESKEQCAAVVLRFPFEVAKMAPGITISQTVIEIKDGEEISNSHIDTAEKQLQTQRNLAARPGNLTRMIARRVPKTGKAAVGKDEDGYYDKASVEKLKMIDDAQESLFKKIIPKEIPKKLKKTVRFPIELKRLTTKENSWIAVIHADGNDLGVIIPKLFKNVTGKALIELQHNFSQRLSEATEEAVQTALDTVFGRKDANLYYDDKKEKVEIPMRPIICGGDDLTVVIRAKDALEFTEVFLREFSIKTKEKLAGLHTEFKDGLTACAGIAYVKQKYPFHYAVDLAGELCSHAKKNAKKLNQKLTPACLSFYKIESNFVREYKEIIEKELQSPSVGLLSKCPYMLETQAGYKTIQDVQNWVLTANKKDHKAVTSRLRQLLSMLHTQSREAILFELKRINQIAQGKRINQIAQEKLIDLGIDFNKDENALPDLSHLHDFLSINSINE